MTVQFNNNLLYFDTSIKRSCSIDYQCLYISLKQVVALKKSIENTIDKNAPKKTKKQVINDGNV